MKYTLSFSADEARLLKEILANHVGLPPIRINPLINAVQLQLDEQDRRVQQASREAQQKAAHAAANATAAAIAAERGASPLDVNGEAKAAL